MINKILISKEKRKAINSYNKFIGMEGENLQEVLLFCLNEKIEGTGKVEVELPDGTKGIIDTNNTEEGFELPIKSSLLAQTGFVKFQLRILQNEEVIFKSDIIELRVKESINATDTIPDEYPTWIDIADKKISEIDEQIEESKNQSSYAKEQGDYAKEKAEEVKNLNTEYIENALEKTKIFNENVQKKTDDYNSNSTEKMKAFNDNADLKLEEYNKNATEKINTFNNNAQEKTTEFNNNATNKTNTYNTNATVKQKAFDDNVTNKTTTFNNNTTTKTNEFNQNATDKLKEYNDNATDKINKYNEHVAEKTEKDKLQDEEIETIKQKDTSQDKLILELQKENASLKEENKNIKNQFPKGYASGNVIHLEDSSDLEFDWKLRGGSKQETRKGSNLLNFNVTQNSKVTVNGDGTITINGTGGFSLNFEELILKNGLTYYQKLELVSGSISGTAITNAFMSFDGNRWMSNNFILYSPTEDLNKHAMWINGSAVFENAVIKIWANTDQSDFEQYGAMPSPNYPSEIETVGQNINELDNGYTEKTKDGIEVMKNNDGSLHLKGIATKNVSIGDFLDTNIRKGEYVLTITTKGKIDGIVYYNIEGDSTRIVRDLKLASNSTISKKLTFDTDKILDWKFFYIIAGVTIDCDMYFKIEKGTKATPYSPFGQGSVEIKVDNNLASTDENYKEDSVIMPIQKEMLEGDWIDDKEYHGWGEWIATGTENWLFEETENKFGLYNLSIALDSNTLNQSFCTHYKNYNIYANSKNSYGLNKGFIRFYNDLNMTLEQFKGWLAEQYAKGTPVTIKYKLAEPEILELTEEQKQAREKILKTYKNITNISVDNELASLDVTYYKDRETIDKKIDDRLAALESAILS